MESFEKRNLLSKMDNIQWHVKVMCTIPDRCRQCEHCRIPLPKQHISENFGDGIKNDRKRNDGLLSNRVYIHCRIFQAVHITR